MGWTLQDFTTFTEVDPNSKITVDADEITVVDSAYVDESYVRKDFGVGYFTGDFKFKVHIRPTSGLSGSWCLANSAISVQGMNYPINDGILVWTTKGTSYHLLSIQDNESGGYADNCSITDGTDYYLLIERTSGTITCKVYTDEAMTSLLDTLNTGSTNNTAYRYLFGYVNYGLAAVGTATTYVKNLYLYEAESIVATPTADPDSCSFVPPLKVILSCATSGSTIYYTTDWIDPDEESEVYTTPLCLIGGTRVKARAYKDGLDPSEIATFDYSYSSANAAYYRTFRDGYRYLRLLREDAIVKARSIIETVYLTNNLGYLKITDNFIDVNQLVISSLGNLRVTEPDELRIQETPGHNILEIVETDFDLIEVDSNNLTITPKSVTKSLEQVWR